MALSSQFCYDSLLVQEQDRNWYSKIKLFWLGFKCWWNINVKIEFNILMNHKWEVFVTVEFHTFSHWIMFTKWVRFFYRFDVAFVWIICNRVININKIKLQMFITNWCLPLFLPFPAETPNAELAQIVTKITAKKMNAFIVVFYVFRPSWIKTSNSLC